MTTSNVLQKTFLDQTFEDQLLRVDSTFQIWRDSITQNTMKMNEWINQDAEIKIQYLSHSLIVFKVIEKEIRSIGDRVAEEIELIIESKKQIGG